MSTSPQILEGYVSLIAGFDHIRAGKYVDPATINEAIETTQSGYLIDKYFPDWDNFFQQFEEKFSRTRFITKLAEILKNFELSVLATYVTFLGFDMLSEVAWISTILPWATIFVFLFFGYVYGVTYFVVEKPMERYLEKYLDSNRKTRNKLHKLVSKLVYELDSELLGTGQGAGQYLLKLYAKDYPGIFVTTKPSRLGDNAYRANPYPLHVIFNENRTQIKVLMLSYRDDHLLKALSDLPGKYVISLVVTRDIIEHRIFQSAANNILKNNSKNRIYVTPNQKMRTSTVFTVDGVWQIVLGRSLKPSELKYAPVEDESNVEELYEEFKKGVDEGEKFRS